MNRVSGSAYRLLPLFLLSFLVPPPAGAQLVRERPDKLAAAALPSHTTVKPGSSMAVRVKFRVQPRAWYYGPKPGGVIVPAQPSTLTVPKNLPFTFGNPTWPKTVVHETDLGGGEKDKHNVYMGEKILFVPVKVKSNAPKKAYSFPVVLMGQVCTESTCIPVKAPATVRITVGNANVPNKGAYPPYPKAKVSEGPSETGGEIAFGMGATESPPPSSPAAPAGAAFDVTKQVKVDAPKTSWLWVLLAAFVGGIIMNVMPCVLPVVPIKVYTFLDHAHQDHGKALRLAVSFAAGMIAVFLALGVLMASVRGLWGAQFQSPVFVVTLGGVMFMMALWLMGAYTVPVPQSVAGVKVSGGDYAGSFGMGALATLLATPCSGPFLGGAIAWAATQSPPLILLTFGTIGVGMASPYVLLVAQPKLLRKLPRPGPWMETWKQSMALLMFGVTIYFVSLLPAEMHVPFLLFCLALGAAVWIMNRWAGLTASRVKRNLAGVVAMGVVVAGTWFAYTPRYAAAGPAQQAATTGELEWTPFSTQTLNAWLSQGETVIVEWTADWCINCKILERQVYHQAKVVDRLKGNVKLMRADISGGAPEAEKLLQQLGGASLPFSAVFRGEDPTRPVILRDMYTADQLLAALGAPSTVAARPRP
ncbi:MAG: thioredoxin family protein [Armatimonadetes bacterium]|nr:thioredoxin family protein [Armatimonadota bacterium]